MKRSILLPNIALLISSAFVFSEPLTASAGVLTRSGSSGIHVRVPRVRERNVRSTSAVLKATNPDLNYHGQTLDKIYARMQKQDRKYDQEVARWERKVQRIQERARRLEQRKREQEQRKAEKEREMKLRAEHKATPSGQADQSVAHDPRAWFTQRIAGVGSGGSLSARGSAPQQPPAKASEAAKQLKQPENGDKRGQDLTPPEPKKASFWTHVWRALGLN
ncbi:MAG: hypothetical protein U0136_16195 [Bdellovibrionota bacterium]